MSGISGYPYDLWQNNAAFFQGPNGAVVGKRFINSSPITGGGRFYFEKTTGYPENVHTINQGAFDGNNAGSPIIFYDTTQSAAPKIFDVQNIVPTNTLRQNFVPPTETDALGSCSPVYYPQADLSVTKIGAGTVMQGTTFSYVITVNNAGPSNASGVSVLDNMPASFTAVTWACAANGSADCDTTVAGIAASGSGNTISLNNVHINAGAGNFITITATGTASSAGTLTNTVSVSMPGIGTDTNTLNNTAMFTTTVASNSVHLTISKTNQITSLTAGGTTSYTVTVGNLGPAAANSAVLKDALSAGLQCTSVSCNQAISTTTCPTPGAEPGLLSLANLMAAGVSLNLPANSQLVFHVDCQVTASGL